MEHSYEIRFCRPDGRLSLFMLQSFASDRHALQATQHMLSPGMPSASICQDGRDMTLFVGVGWDKPAA